MSMYVTYLARVTEASVLVTRVQEHACSEECTFHNLLKQQASFLNISTCLPTTAVAHLFSRNMERPGLCWEGLWLAGGGLKCDDGHGRTPNSTSTGSPPASPAPSHGQQPTRLLPCSLSPATSDFSPPHPLPQTGQEARDAEPASQRERLCNNLIASNYKQPRSPRSQGCQTQQNVSSSPRGRKEEFCSSNKTRVSRQSSHQFRDKQGVGSVLGRK